MPRWISPTGRLFAAHREAAGAGFRRDAAGAARPAAGSWSSRCSTHGDRPRQPVYRFRGPGPGGPLGEDPHGLGGHRTRGAGQVGGRRPGAGPVRPAEWRSGRPRRRARGRPAADRSPGPPVHSIVRARVMPGRQPEVTGGVWISGVQDDEVVRPGALAELSDRVAEQRLGGAVSMGAGQGDDVLGVRGGLHSRRGPRARCGSHGTVIAAVESGRRAVSPTATTRVGPCSPRPTPSGPWPPV